MNDTTDNFLIEHSLSGKRWKLRDYESRITEQLMQQFGITDITARLLSARGITADTYHAFVAPRLRTSLPAPDHLHDISKAAERIIAAIDNQERVAVFGDYDVDGATSTALMIRFLRSFGLDPDLYIPDRIEEGYGPNPQAIKKLCEDHDLLLTVDCGITAFEAMDAAKPYETDLIIIDHHTAEPELPDVYAVVNPNRLDETGELGHMAAVGVVFLTIICVLTHLKQRGMSYDDLPDPRQWLDLVALGTICDVMKLRGLNRAFVTQGLKVMSKRLNPGLKALCDVSGVEGEIKSHHPGFVLGPRINAAGRIGDTTLGTRLLISDDRAQAQVIAQTLDRNNRERQAMEKQILREAMAKAREEVDQHDYIMCIAGEGWHPGIVGLVASRLVSEYNRPAAAITIDETGMGKASSRSISGIDLGNLVIAARQEGILESGGGHAMAAGFTLKRENIPVFQAYARERIIELYGEEPLKPVIKVDATIAPQSVNMALYQEISQLEPYGNGNPKPRFLIKDAVIKGLDILSGKHIRLYIGDSYGHGSLKVISFNTADSAMGRALQKAGKQSRVNLVGALRLNEWQGRRTIEMHLDDAALAEQN